MPNSGDLADQVASTCQPNGENDIIQTVRNGDRNILSLMAAMLCGVGLLCATSDDVAARVFNGFPIEARGRSVLS